METGSLTALQQLQIEAALKKYAKNLRKLFWCILGLMISGALLGFLLTLVPLEIIDKDSPILAVSAGATLVFGLAYLWIKADCLDFELNLSITKWLNIACLLDFSGVACRMGVHWFGWQDWGKALASAFGSMGLLMFVYFLAELAKFTSEQSLVTKARNILYTYAVSFALMLIVLFLVRAKLLIGPFTFLGLGLAWIMSFLVASINFQLLLWQLPTALRKLADSVLNHGFGTASNQD